MIFQKQTCRAVGTKIMELLLLPKYLCHGISPISKPSFKMYNSWKLIAKSKQKRYAYANNHIIKAFIGEQTLMGRNNLLVSKLITKEKIPDHLI